MNYQFFPRSQGISNEMNGIIKCFRDVDKEINSTNNELESDEVLKLLTPSLMELGFKVEIGKKNVDKIKVPVLFGQNNTIDKEFNADALSKDGKIVIEVEAGRAVCNNQFLKDIFQACMMFGVEYLVVAVREIYKKQNNFKTVNAFLETLYVSNRLHLPLKGILLIGY